MKPFNFRSQTHFVASSDGTTLQVYVLTIPGRSSIQKTDFKQIADIHPHYPNLTAVTKEMETCNGLHLADGNIEGEKALTTLAQHLSQLRLLVNPYGYCLQDVVQLCMYTDYQIHYLRLNDRFRWSKYGIKISITIRSSATHDNRSELNHWVPERMMPITPYEVVSQDTYDELEEDMEDAKSEKERMKERQSYFESELRKKDEEVMRWTQVSKEHAELDKLLEEKKSKKQSLEKEKEKAEEYKKVWKQRGENVFKGGALAFGAAKIVASAVGTAAYAGGSAAVNTAGAVRKYVADRTPAAKKAEAERRQKEKNLMRRRRVPHPET